MDQPTAVTVGNFDGLHRGHRALIRELIDLARSEGLKSSVLTFANNPLEVLRPGREIKYLTSLPEKIALLYELGVDYVVPLHFDTAMAQTSADDFAALLKDRLRMEMLLMGPDNRLGYRGEGTYSRMTEIGKKLDFSVEVLKPYQASYGITISSTAIREAVRTGQVQEAATLLGRTYAVSGCVVRPADVGPVILAPLSRALPSEGSFRVQLVVGQTSFQTWACFNPKPEGAGYQTIQILESSFEPDAFIGPLSLQLLDRLTSVSPLSI